MIKKLTLLLFAIVFTGIGEFASGQTGSARDKYSLKIGSESIDNVELLSRYLQIPSVTGSEKEAGLFIMSVCEQNGLYITDLGNQEGNFNFAASLFPLDSKKPNIILLNHIDVVPAGDEAKWEHPPFGGKIVDGEIWGRGALDMKGIGIAQLAGLLQFKTGFSNPDFDYNITFLAVSAEEVISDYGASYVVDNYLELLNPVAVFCEGPTGLDNIISSDKDQKIFGIGVAEKKPLRISLRLTHNTFAHGAGAPESYAAKDLTLALSKLLSKDKEYIFDDTNMGMIKGLGEMEKGIVGFVMRHPYIFKPLLKFKLKSDPRMLIFFTNSITLVDYKTVSHSSNSIPQSMECRLDCRLMPEQEISAFVNSIKETIRNPDIEIILGDSLEGAKPSPKSGYIIENFEKAILKNFPDAHIVPALIPGYSDCLQFRKMGIPSYGSNPFMMDQEMLSVFHNFNERISLSALESATNVYFDFLNGLLKDPSKH